MKFLVGILFSLWLISRIRRAQASTFHPLNMSVTAFDDQYEGCAEEMERKVLEDLLAKEKNAVPKFGKIWDKAVKTWKDNKWTLPGGIPEVYGFAITAYTANDIYEDFHKAVRDYKGWDQFPYHSMHFLLTRALVLLGKVSSKSTLFRGVKGTSFKEKKGTEMRFGQFASSSMSKTEAEKFGNDTFFNLTSCFGVSIKKYSYFSTEEEVLIPVDEIFKVTSFTEEAGKTRLVLTTTERRCHYYNCNYINKGKKSSKCVYSGGTRMFSSLAVVVLLFQVIMFS